jgi:hypothetical protein
MPLRDFDGNTFVAFCDIAGFRNMLSKDKNRAAKALDAFYNCGYQTLRDQRNGQGGAGAPQVEVDGIFISDCGVLYALAGNARDQLKAICLVLAKIHKSAFEKTVQLASAIAYGDFSCHLRMEFDGIHKSPILGAAYVNAFDDHSSSKPKLFHPEIRIVKEGLPPDATELCGDRQDVVGRKMRNEQDHFYFEWMRNDHDPI